ncbi:hypothetical protein [Chitinasiproducens palmae]|uniref:Uncharacterized protein n=1 Tax=Chitinasiproducens palmae TaxID=1770053 RepID=A0A1H2PXH1_9BURK|nr:hypothetical protein [Chitinasiproducens palmae]SDV51688.1 hypothetical protein SAMN05216551_12210 [Chitinasiproducens palmae]
MLQPATLWRIARQTGGLVEARLHPGTPDERSIQVRYVVKADDEFDGAAANALRRMIYPIDEGSDIKTGTRVLIGRELLVCRIPQPHGSRGFERQVAMNLERAL